MELTEVRINLCGDRGGRLKAFCSLTFDNTFVIRDVKLIDGNDGLFLAMPSRKLCDHCPSCKDKNHLRARYCNNCGRRLNEDRYQQLRNGHGYGHGNGNGNGNGHAPRTYPGHSNGNGNGHGNGHAAPPANFLEWCYRTFGAGITKHFMIPYNRKVWGRITSLSRGASWN